MIYRICLTVQPGAFELEEQHKWLSGQVHAEYPKMSGTIGEYLTAPVVIATFGDTAPNLTVVLVSATGSLGKDGSPTGCYASIYSNESDFTYIPVEYPVYNYTRVNPVQLMHEGPLDIISSYKVDKYSLVYADLFQSSLKSFDKNIWCLLFFVFAGLLHEKLGPLTQKQRILSHIRDLQSLDWTRVYRLL